MPIISQSQAFNKKPAQKTLLLNTLLTGKRLTQDDFVKMTKNNFAKIAARKYDLKQQGYPVKTEDIPLSDGTVFTEYYLPDWFLSDVKTVGLDRALDKAIILARIQTAIDKQTDEQGESNG